MYCTYDFSPKDILIDVLISFVQKGMPVRKLYATSERGQGVQLARKIMTETQYPGDHTRQYELDIEQSDSILLRPYKDTLDKWRQEHKD